MATALKLTKTRPQKETNWSIVERIKSSMNFVVSWLLVVLFSQTGKSWMPTPPPSPGFVGPLAVKKAWPHSLKTERTQPHRVAILKQFLIPLISLGSPLATFYDSLSHLEFWLDKVKFWIILISFDLAIFANLDYFNLFWSGNLCQHRILNAFFPFQHQTTDAKCNNLRMPKIVYLIAIQLWSTEEV